jgi:hypothetical protein
VGSEAVNGRIDIDWSHLEELEYRKSKDVNQTQSTKVPGLVNRLRVGELGTRKEHIEASVTGDHYRRD